MGLAALLHMSALAFQALKLAGAAYLLYLAWAMWREKGMIAFDRPAEVTGGRKIAVRAFLMNILNPKLSILLPRLPAAVRGTARGCAAAQMLILSSVFMAMTLGVFIAYPCSPTARERGFSIRARPDLDAEELRRRLCGARRQPGDLGTLNTVVPHDYNGIIATCPRRKDNLNILRNAL